MTNQWQPIDTAPDDVVVLVWAPGARDQAEGEFSYGLPDPCVVVAIRKAAESRIGWSVPAEGYWTGDLVDMDSGYESTGPFCETLLIKADALDAAARSAVCLGDHSPATRLVSLTCFSSQS